MKKNAAKIITILFLCFMPIWMIISKDVAFSDKENRNLATFPKFSWSRLVSGDFMDDFETYLADQFPLRNLCVSIKTAALRATGKKVINDVYIAKDNYLIAKEESYTDEKLKEMVDLVNTFAAKAEGVDVSLMVVPNSSAIYENKLPYGAKSTEKDTLNKIYKLLNKDVSFINIYTALKAQKSVQLYYKTDHHWTTKGAYYGFLEYAKEKDIKPVNYNFYTVTSNFQGTQASNSGVYSVFEKVEVCAPDNSVGTYVVNYVNENKKTTTIFDKSKLSEKDKYQVFFGGNYAEIDISTTANTGRRLMLIKDSYANCLVSMLTPYYDKIIVIDPRYFYDDLNIVMKVNKINEVLFLYNVNSFVTDNSLSDLINVNN